MDPNIISALIGFTGVFIGVVLSGIGFLLKERRESKKVANKCIFNLLNIWHAISTLDKSKIDKFSKIYVQKVSKLLQGMELEGSEQKEQLEVFCSNISYNFMSSFGKKIDKSFKDEYYLSINELAKVSPLLAYDLSDNKFMDELLEHFDTFYSQTFPEADNVSDGPEKQFLNDFQDGLQAGKASATKKFIKNLESDICKLAFENSFLLYVKCKVRFFREKQKFSERNLNKHIDKYIEGTVKPLLAKKYQ